MCSGTHPLDERGLQMCGRYGGSNPNLESPTSSRKHLLFPCRLLMNAFCNVSDTPYILLFVMHLSFREDHSPLVAPDFVSADNVAKTSVGEGLPIGVFVHPSVAFVQKPSDRAALTDSGLIPQTLT